MASEVLGLNSAFAHNKDLINYADHLYENHILDDVEPQYENNEIFCKILQKTNGFSKSLGAIHEEALNAKTKEENIYENIGFIENVLGSLSSNEKDNIKEVKKLPESSIQEEVVSTFNTIIVNGNKDVNDKKESKNRFTSTFSLTIGKPLNVEVSDKHDSEIKKDKNKTGEDSELEEEGSDDANFKSSYAKSLIDSLKKSNTSSSNNAQIIPTNECQLKIAPSSSTQEDIKPIVTFAPLISKGPLPLPSCLRRSSSKASDDSDPSRTLEQLEKRVSSLTDNVLMKDKELEKLRQELMLLKLECNRVKAENRNLKMGLNSSLTHRTSSPFHTNGESQHSSFSSVSPDSDTWTLQQQVLTLNAQLEKAELSRRAYEAATRQLVHFLQTINTTLSTVAGPDCKIESPFTPQNTSELLTNLELSLLQNRIRTNASPRPKLNSSISDSIRDESLSFGGDLASRSEGDRSSKHRQETLRKSPTSKESRLSAESAAPHHSISSSSSQDSTKQTRERNERSSSSSAGETRERRATKRASPQRRFSISQKVWNATKKPLARSGSVSNLPSEKSPIPRVSRAVSTHCVATNKIDALAHCPENDPRNASDSGSANSNRILSAKAKDFFSSLKNIFKSDADRTPGPGPTPVGTLPTQSHVDASTNTKKKLTLPSLHRSSKVKAADPPPLSLPPSSSHLKKKHSLLKTHSMPRVTPSSDTERPSSPQRPNSVFYVSCFTNDDEGAPDGDLHEEPQSSKSDEERNSSLNSLTEASSSHVVEEELSGPQELSVALSVQEPLQEASSFDVETPSGYVKQAEVVNSDDITVHDTGQEECRLQEDSPEAESHSDDALPLDVTQF